MSRDDETFEREYEKRLETRGIETRRDRDDFCTVNAEWNFEGLLTNHDYVPSRVAMILGLIKDPQKITMFQLYAPECVLGIGYSCFHHPILGGTLSIGVPRGQCAGMKFDRGRTRQPLEDVVDMFQRMSEWFTIQTSIYKAMEQGHRALERHHRYADAEQKFLDVQQLVLENFHFLPRQ